MKNIKKQRVIYKETNYRKEEDLQEFLFGAEPESIFEREKEEEKEAVTDLVRKATRGGLVLADADLFFEDTRGEDDSECSSEASGSDDEGSDFDNPSPRGKRTRQAEAKAKQGQVEPAGRTSDSGGSTGGEAEGGAGSQGGSDGEEAVPPGSDEQDAEGDGAQGFGGPAGARSSAGASTSGASRPGGARVPVWSDPHVAAVRVDVAASARLRKLRKDDQTRHLQGSEYEAALRKQHQALNPRTKWATKRATATATATAAPPVSGAEAGEDDGEVAALLARAGGLVELRVPGAQRLPAGQVETTRLPDANQHQPSEAVVQAVRFHPGGELLLTAGLDKKLRLFQVDGLRNPLVQAVHLDDLPITDAAFAPPSSPSSPSSAADRVVLAGRRPFFYLYDLAAARVERVQGPAGCGLRSLERFAVAPASACSHSSEPLVAFCGDSGAIPLVSLTSRQWVASLRMSGNVRAAAFSHDGRELVSTGDDGVVHFWDLRTRRCRLTLVDEGATGDAASLALSPDGALLATGSRSGCVNVYRRAEVEAAATARGGGGAGGVGVGVGGRVVVAPARELTSLTSCVDTLEFSPDSQMLAFASRMKRDALRLAHLPSLTVFANWPTGRTPLHYVHSLDFSPHCGLVAIGNAKGRALLYRLHHYQQA